MKIKLAGHALENFKKVKGIINSGMSSDEIDEKLMEMYQSNEFKGGKDMIRISFEAICKEYPDANGFKLLAVLNHDSKSGMTPSLVNLKARGCYFFA